MRAIFFLFRRKAFYWARFALLFTGYDIKRRDFMEELYGVYVAFIMVGWLLVMAGMAVTTVAQPLAKSPLGATALQSPLFYGMAAWLATTPWLAQRSYDLYRFSLSDLDFLSGAPFRPPLVAAWWFVKSLFSRWNGAIILALGILAGAEGQNNGTGDLLGLAVGIAGSVVFIAVVSALVWLMGLLRYRPTPAFGAMPGYALSLLAFGVLFALPVSRQIFYPAWLASSLVAGQPSAPGGAMWALGALSAMALAGLVGIVLVSGGTLLAPAFEEGRLGGQLRRAAGLSAASASASRAGSRRAATTRDMAGSSEGVLSALFLKQRLRLARLPFMQLMGATVAPALLGAAMSLVMLSLPMITTRIEVLAPAAFFACFALIRSGVTVLRNDFTHIDFFAGWPISRRRLAIYDTLMGFVLPLLGGEVALLGAMPFAGAPPVLLWAVLWPLLVAVSAVAGIADFMWQLRKWPATPETLPEAGPVPIVAASVAWVLVLWVLSGQGMQ